MVHARDGSSLPVTSKEQDANPPFHHCSASPTVDFIDASTNSGLDINTPVFDVCQRVLNSHSFGWVMKVVKVGGPLKWRSSL